MSSIMRPNLPRKRQKSGAKRDSRIVPSSGRLDRPQLTRRTSAFNDTALHGIPSIETPYVCTGRFAIDFFQLCRRRLSPGSYIPPVTPKPHRPTMMHASSGGFSKGWLKSLVSVSDPMSSGKDDMSIAVEPPPKTYTIREPSVYFKPTVQIEIDRQSGDSAAVSEICIHGWRLDDAMVDILSSCCPRVMSLSVLDLWNVGLIDDTLQRLAAMVLQCPVLRTLMLDANPVPSQRWDLFLQDNSPVEYLSIRYNKITEVGARLLGKALGCPTRQNERLLTLELAGNQIGNEGAIALADGLRLNRSLLILGVAGNGIGDAGIVRFAKTLSKFELKHEEIIERRRLFGITRMWTARHIAGSGGPSPLGSGRVGKPGAGVLRPIVMATKGGKKGRLASPTDSSRHSPRIVNRVSVASASSNTSSASHTSADTPRGQLKQFGKMSIAMQPGKRLESSLKKSATTSGKTSPTGSKFKKSRVSMSPLDAQDDVLMSEKEAAERNALLSVTIIETPNATSAATVVIGNRTLISLNLNRNEVTDAGVLAILDALLPHFRSMDSSVMESYAVNGGILRISIAGNPVSTHVRRRFMAVARNAALPVLPYWEASAEDPQTEVSIAMEHLQNIMTARDPILKIQPSPAVPANTFGGGSIMLGKKSTVGYDM